MGPMTKAMALMVVAMCLQVLAVIVLIIGRI